MRKPRGRFVGALIALFILVLGQVSVAAPVQGRGTWPWPVPPTAARFADGFPAEFHVPTSQATNQPVGGWGCDSSGRIDGGEVRHVPILFVHGNAGDAHDWDGVRRYFLDHGYSLCETWAVSYGYGDARRWDSNVESAPTVQAFVENMLAYLQQHKNVDVTQVNIIAHSLGGTIVRTWLKDTGAYHQVRSLVAIAAPNHGLGGCWPGAPRVCGEIAPGSRWLTELNAGDETPGNIRYMTIYDGTGAYDPFYWGSLRNSPALAGAVNHPYNVQNGTRLDHIGLKDQTAALQLHWLQGDAVDG